MRAYKFLDHHHRAPFSGFRWPVPGPGDEAGPWVEAGAVAPCREGIHGCRPSDLGFWLNEVLWEIELDGDIVEAGTKVVAARGRLRRLIPEWAGGVARQLVESAGVRARDHAVALCRNGSAPTAAVDALAACTAIDQLSPTAIALYHDLPEGSDEQTAVGFVIDAVHFLDARVFQSPFVAACAAGHAASARTGSRSDWEAAVTAERTWQSAWITDRLALR